jgi:hypothetical protein
MNNSDIINGAFEMLGGFFILLSIRRVLIDKQVKGVSVLSTVYFTTWGLWNIYFYPQNDLFFSFIGGIFLSLCNGIWVILLIYYFYTKRI